MSDASTSAATHLVFVDFENVPRVDLDLVAAQPAFVTLLIGKNQTKLDTRLVTQIHRHATKVRLIEVGASGRNALDLVLAHYLGRAVAENPRASLHIVSKDKDFEPLIAHLRSGGVNVARSESFAALPFLQPPRSAAASRRPAAFARKSPTSPQAEDRPSDTLTKLVGRLTNPAAARPKKKERLLHHIETALGKGSSPEKAADTLRLLEEQRILEIGPDGKVRYRLPARSGRLENEPS